MSSALILADTHIRGDGRRALPRAVRQAAAQASLIIHAGDVVDPSVLADLGDYAPVHAVLGNNDHGLVGTLPDRWVSEVDGVPIAIVHDSGPVAGRPVRLSRWFPDAAVVIFGHSHMPFCGAGVGGQWLFNPGSCTERRRSPTHTFGWLTVRPGGHITLELRNVTE